MRAGVPRASGLHGGGLDEHIHLLADIEVQVRSVDAVDGLEHPGVDPLETVARERALRNDDGFDAHEAQG